MPEEVLTLRRRQAKNFCSLLFLSAGTPMFRAGDEFLQTQSGNNNPYNQDNETAWLDWSRLETNREIFVFFKKMIAFRKAHRTLCRSRYWRDEVAWHGVENPVDFSTESRSLAFHLDGASQHDADLYVMINGFWEGLQFRVQHGEASEWKRVIDTARPSPNDFVEGDGESLDSLSYHVGPRSIVVLIRQRRNK